MIAWPAAGPSTTIRSHCARPLELLDLAEHDEVVDAGRGGADDVDHPTRRQPLGDPREAVVVEVLARARRWRRSSGPRCRARASRAAACRRARRPARAAPCPLRRVRAQPLPWSCRHPLCRPRPRRWRRSRSATDRPPDGSSTTRSPEAPLRRLLIGLLAGTALAGAAGVRRRPASAQDDGRRSVRSTCCRSAGCSTTSSSTRSATPSNASDEQGAQALVLQVNSRGAVVGDDVMAELLQRDRRRPAADRRVGRSGRGRPPVRHAGADPRRRRRHRHGARRRVGYTGPPLELADATIDFGTAADSLRNALARAVRGPRASTCSSSASPTRGSPPSPTCSTRSTGTRRTESCSTRRPRS